MKKGVGVYIGRKQVIAASVIQTKNGFEIDRFSIEQINPQEDLTQVAAELSGAKSANKKKPVKIQTPEGLAVLRALKSIGAEKQRITMAFNPFQLVTRYYQIPYVPPKEWQATARYEASRYIPFKLEETVADFHIQKQGAQDNASLGVACTASKVDVLRYYLNALSGVSVKVDMIEPVFSSFARALAVQNKALKQQTIGLIFVDIDEGVHITLAHQGMVYLSRDFLLSGDKDASKTRFYEEIKLSLDYMKQVSGQQAGHVYLAGSGELQGWKDFLEESFKETAFELSVFPAREGLPRENQSELVIAAGLALHQFKMASPVGDFELLPRSEQEVKPERLIKTIQLEFLIITVAFVVFRLAIGQLYVDPAQREAMGKMSPEIANDILAQQSVQELTVMRDQLKSKQDALNMLAQKTLPLSQKFKILSKALPREIWLEQVTYEAPDGKKPGTFSFRGQCYAGNPEMDVQIINQWIKRLNDDKEFLKGLKRLTASEVRREKFLNRDTTLYAITSE